MFEIGDVVIYKKYKQRCDHNKYVITNVRTEDLAENIMIPCYDIALFKNKKINQYYSVPERYLSLDSKYYRRKKIEQIKDKIYG